jgi:hypothetical protein
MLIVPRAAPVSSGEKVTETVHESPAPNVLGEVGQVVPLTANPGDTAIPKIVSAVVCVFFSVTVAAEETEPTGVEENVRLDGLTVVCETATVANTRQKITSNGNTATF